MKHTVSVEELLELHRLGELFVKWSTNPFALSERELGELENICRAYNINGTSALFAFQQEFQREFGLTAQNTKSVIQTLDEALAQIPGVQASLARAQEKPLLADAPQNEVGKLLAQASWADDWKEELRLLLAARDTGDIPLAAHERISELQERNKAKADNERVTAQLAAEGPEGPRAALLEQLHEDNEVDREQQQSHAAELRDELVTGNYDAHREMQILRDISNVDELSPAEKMRLDELAEWARNLQPTIRSINVPAAVVQDAISTGQIQKVK